MAAPRKVSPDRIVDAAMTLAAERRWREVTLRGIAEAAGVTLAQLHEAFRSKGAVVAALFDRIDAKVLGDEPEGAVDEPTRERLLDVLMRRFEALGPYKKAIASIMRDGGGHPMAALCGGARLLRSMAWSLEAAGVGSAGPMGRLRVKGLSAIYASAFCVWLRDDSPDLGRTMAALDRGLRRAERLVTALSRPRRSDKSGDSPATA